jgi:class 3 adenylate cyclase/tetratricopeptide (TPR) repeat protein
MTFEEVFEHALAMLQRHGRVSYGALRRQFDLDDDYLDDLKDALLFAHPVVDEAGRGLVWSGETGAPAAPASATPAPAQPSQATPSIPDAERRQLTVMFCDLVGSTPLSERLDPEDLREVVRAYQDTCAEVIQRYGGHIAQLLGDGLLVYFGWPQAHEDEAARAVQTGLEMLEAMGALNERLERDRGLRLAIRVGIHTGLVVVGRMGGGGHQEQLALGEAPNVAARLQGVANPNTVVVSAVTHRLIEGYFTSQALGAHALQGVERPMTVYRVLHASGAQTRFEAAARRGFTPLVGREQEEALLRQRWALSRAGQGQVVLLSGEAGIGKSRLVAVVREHVTQAGCPCNVFRCAAYHTNSALYPVIEHVQRLLQLHRDDTPETKLAKLEQGLQPDGFDVDTTVPLVAGLLAVPLSERYAPLTLSAQQQRQQTLETLVSWLLAEAARHPTLLVVEDLHWADASTLEWLSLVIERVAAARMLAVCTFRPEFHPPWPMAAHLVQVTLNRFSPAQIARMATQIAGDQAMPSEVLEQIVLRTDGVPLFVEELTKTVLESGVLADRQDGQAPSEPSAALTIPATLHDALMARLDRLGEAKAVAQLGATVGRTFPYEVLRAVSPLDETALQRALEQLTAAELCTRRGTVPQASYTFKHALIQDAAYQSLLRSTRQQYHRSVAQVLAERFPETAETQPELLAYHYTEAGLHEQGVRYWHEASQRARAHSAYAEEIGHLTRGLALLHDLPDTPGRAQHELSFQTSLSQALMFTKGYAAPEVLHAYRRARDLAQQVGDDTSQLLRILRGLEMCHSLRGEFRAAHKIAEQILDLAHHLRDPAHLIAAHYVLGQLYNIQGLWAESRAHFEQAVALYDPAQRQQQLIALYGFDLGATAFGYLGRGLWPLGYADQAVQKSHQAVRMVRKESNPFPLVNAAYIHLCRGEGGSAQDMAEEAIRVSTDRGLEHWLALGMIKRGAALVMQGRCAEGLAQLQQGVSASQATGAAGRQHYFAMLADAYHKCNQTETALQVVHEALSRIPTSEEYAWEAELHRLEGEFRLAPCRREYAAAEASFHRALAAACRHRAKAWELRAATSLARLWQSQDKRQEASDLLAPVYGWFTEGFDIVDVQEAKVVLEALS